MNFTCSVASLLLLLSGAAASRQSAGSPQYLTFDQAKPVLRAQAMNLPADLKGPGPLTASEWATWVQKEDAAIR
ncbi:MAG TPA: hypothetical protein VJW51_03445, partial [Candidatus Acidoferrales bacterium]|nr:hypothetical protein [Candidatus Acidoferrales bacterium]